MEVMSNNIALFLKKQKKETTEYIFKEKKKICCRMRAPLTAPPLPPSSLPPSQKDEKRKEALRERGRKTGTGRQQAGWLVMDETMPF